MGHWTHAGAEPKDYDDVIVIVMIISKLLKRYSKLSTLGHQLIHERCDESKGGFQRGGQEKLRSDFQSTRMQNCTGFPSMPASHSKSPSSCITSILEPLHHTYVIHGYAMLCFQVQRTPIIHTWGFCAVIHKSEVW